MSGDLSLFERLEAVTSALGEITEELSEATYTACEQETLKRVAIAAGVDHTMESTRVIGHLHDVIQRERDVNRELQRRIRGLEHEIARQVVEVSATRWESE